MKKSYYLICIFIFIIFLISLFGSLIVSGDILVNSEKSIFDIQKNYEKYFSPYGYTIDNPNIIINPYGNSPLTALIMFETEKYSKVNIIIKGKNNNDINYTFKEDKYHLIPIYGLYADYNNTIILKSENKEKIINIKTEKLPSDFKFIDSDYGNYKFLNGNYPYAIDSYGDIRWYLSSKYYGNISILGNSKFVIGSDKYTENGNTISIYEMDFLGKIYTEYLVTNDYYGVNCVYDNKIYILSDKIYIVDIQTGKSKVYFDNDGYDYIDIKDENLIVRKDNKMFIYKDDEFQPYEYIFDNNVFEFYDGVGNYTLSDSRIIGKLNKTNTSDKKISLLRYSKEDINGINLISDSDRIIVVNETGKKIYIVFDKLFGKKIYEVDDNKYINKVGLKGRYNIYYKIDGKVYKTNYYVEV